MEPLQERLRALSVWWSQQAMAMRVGLLGVLGILVGAVVAVGLLSGSSEGSPDVVFRTPTPVVTASPTPSPTVTATPSATSSATATLEPTETPEPTPTPDPTINSIDELVSLYGHPAGYEYAQIRIPKLGVAAPVGASYVGGNEMLAPEGPATVFWYDLSGFTNMGGVPGEGKNAIFGAHVDLASYIPYADATYSGPAVFANLNLLAPGDVIYIDINGQTLEYQVVWEKQIAADSGGNVWADIWSSDVAVDSITLYTCGGDFDLVERSYTDRIVLRAERV